MSDINQIPPQKQERNDEFHNEIARIRAEQRNRYLAWREAERTKRSRKRTTTAQKPISTVIMELRKLERTRKTFEANLKIKSDRPSPTQEQKASFDQQLAEARKLRKKHWQADRAQMLYNKSTEEQKEIDRLVKLRSHQEDMRYKLRKYQQLRDSKPSIDERVDKELAKSRKDREEAMDKEIEEEQKRDAVLVCDHARYVDALEKALEQLLLERHQRQNTDESATKRLASPIPPKVLDRPEEKEKPKDRQASRLSPNDIKLLNGTMQPTNIGEFAMIQRIKRLEDWSKLSPPEQYNEFLAFMLSSGQWTPKPGQEEWLEKRKAERK